MGALDNLVDTRAVGDPDPAADQNNLVNALYELPQKEADCASANILGIPGTGSVAGTYANGTAGVGATLTTAVASLTIDGVALTNGMRVLLKDQGTPAVSGLYVVSGVGTTIVFTRAPEADTSTKLSDITVNIAQGTVNADTQWRCSTSNPTIGTTNLQFRRSLPIYGLGNPRNPWDVGGDTAPPVMATMVRAHATSTVTLPTTATHWLFGGIIVPAGRTFNTVNFFYSTAAATITVDYVSIIRLGDRAVIGTSTNSTAAWPAAPAVRARTLSAAITFNIDTPVYVGIALASTTAAVVAGGPAFPSATAQQARPPILLGTTTAPTATPITGTAGTLTAGTLGMVLAWLT